MKRVAFLLPLAFAVAAVTAQSITKPAPQTSPKISTHSTATATPSTHPSSQTTLVKLPPGVPPVRAHLMTAFSLRYQDIVVGTGADAAPRKIYTVHYTGWLASTGRKFDSSYDHAGPAVKDADGKFLRDDKGEVKQGPPQPITFIQGTGRAIPGFDEGFIGMKVGGKRRLFIPWQMAYGELGRDGPDAAHPGIPPKSDLIFDVELLDVKDFTMPANHPPMPAQHPGGPAALPQHPESVQPPPTQPQQQPAQPQAAPQQPK